MRVIFLIIAAKTWLGNYSLVVFLLHIESVDELVISVAG